MRNSIVLSIVLIVLAAIGYFLLAPARYMLPEKIAANAERAAPNAVLGGTPSSEDAVAADEADTDPAEGTAADASEAGDASETGGGSGQLAGPTETDATALSTPAPATSEQAATDVTAEGDTAADGSAAETETATNGEADADAGSASETAESTAAEESDSADATASEAEATGQPQKSQAAMAASQGPGIRAPGGDLVLGGLAYDSLGNVIISGTAREGAQVRVAVNSKTIGEVPVGSDGSWKFVPTNDQVPPGNYQLRVEAVEPSGAVIARASTPFQRVSQEQAISAAASGDVFVVQPGDNLWRIATRVYENGTKYVDIHQANVETIPNPDLIFPGQVLSLPPKD